MRYRKPNTLLTNQSMGAGERNKAMKKRLERIAKKVKREAEKSKRTRKPLANREGERNEQLSEVYK